MKTTTYSELLERHKALEAEILGTPAPQKDNSPRASREYKTAFSEFLRGDPPTNALKIGRDGSGAYLVPDEFEKRLIEGLTAANVLRRISHVVQIDHDKKIPVVASHGTATWVDEEGAIIDSDDVFGQIVLKAYKAATSIKISEELLADAGFDVESYIVRVFGERIGNLEEEAFISGSGIGMPNGILNDAPIGVITEESGKISLDDMIELQYSLGEKYRVNAIWLFSDSVARELRKVKNTIGRPLWEDALSDGEFDTFLGRPVAICNSMPDIASGTKAVLFGDFSYFWIADRQGRVFKRLNELYAQTGQIGFLATQRVDAKLILPEAVKCLQVKE